MSGGHEAREHHLPVTKTARFWTQGSPDAAEVWFVLHGYKQLARRFLRRFEGIAGDDRLVVAPEALSRFYVLPEEGRHGSHSLVGATWMTREDRLVEIEDYVRYLDDLADHLDVADRSLTVLGFSQGVATATRWAAYGRWSPDRLILWADYSPPDLDFERAGPRLRETELVLVRGDADRAMSESLAEEERARFESAGVSYRLVTYGGGHEIDTEVLADLAGGA